MLVGEDGPLAAEAEILLTRAGVPASAFEDVEGAPLLPRGATALRAVQARAAKAAGVGRDDVANVRVSDSDDEITFDRDRPPDRRLRIAAGAPDAARARRLALAFATAYARSRKRFYASLADSLDATQGDGAGRVAARRWAKAEQERLRVLPRTVGRAGEPSPHPVRNGVLAALVCLLALTLVRILRTPGTA